ncbi:hypothetical protein IMW75_13005 [Pseudomonas gregormendelii]|uniref:Uncharacterized protein n=2 Tax=Pseudomonas TaxID=286 RepID=A0A4P6G4E7_9PSED|nr:MULTISPECIES: hypothetical protein [Pseudomonas]MBN3966191.1 hypothetical protein [Pseudomonas gregormendelii]QAY85897.1 hypothetical protein CUN61_18750 [Pseudomonas arsenicoxydans]
MTAFPRDIEQDFDALMELMILVINSRLNSPIIPGMEFLNDIQTLSLKLFKQLCSTKTISTGCVFQSKTGKAYEFIDQGSVSILARANIETFLTLHWLFGGDFQISQFRHRVWQYAGLNDRVNHTATSAEGRAKQDDARVQQMELLRYIQASERLKAYTPKQVDQLLKGNWRVGWSWADEAVRAGFHRKYFDNVYGYLCGYSHSSYISAMQIGQAQDLATQARMSEAGLQISVHIMAHFIHLYASTFSPAADLLRESESKHIADLWHFKSGDMDIIFGEQ